MEKKKVLKSILICLAFLILFLPLFVTQYNSIALSEDQHTCQFSDTRPTVIIQECDSGVNNVLDAYNCTISDRITDCAISAGNHSEFVSCVASLTDNLKKDGVITGREKGRIQSCAAKADIPPSDYVVVTPGEPQRFHFETATDDTSRAIHKVYIALITTPTLETDMIALEILRDEGIEYLNNNPVEASEALIYDALLLDPLDVGRHLSVFHLLSSFDSGVMGVAYLVTQVQRTLPEVCSYGRCLDVRMIRSAALDALGRISAIGSPLAREKVLSFVGTEDLTIQRQAVGLVYETGGMSRWLAKREMKSRLPFCKRHLLYEIY